MKILSYTILVLILTSFINEQQDETNSQTDATNVLKKTSEKLNSLKEVNYSYFRSINYFSEDYHSEAKGTTFVNFDNSDSSLGFKFQIESETSKFVFNGSEYFSLDKQNKTKTIKNNPNPKSFESIPFFFNSLITLKKSLPTIISDSEIQKNLSDTVINRKSYHLASFILENKTLSGFGNFSPITLKRQFLYKIVIDKNSYLPFQVIQTNNVEPKDYTLTAFKDITTTDNAPTELSWYYSTYKEYEQKTDKRLTIIKQNSNAPSFKLPYYDSNDTISLMQLKSKFILLEFWIKNCGYCVQAVSKLNGLTNKFDKKTVEVIGINGSDNTEQIKSFYLRHQPLFKTLYDENGRITQDFGVDEFPQVILLDKKRSVIYSGNLNIEEIEKLLKTK